MSEDMLNVMGSFISTELDAFENLHKELEERDKEIERLNNIIKNTIKELFELKDMIYKPETREINFDVQRKISSMIVKLGMRFGMC